MRRISVEFALSLAFLLAMSWCGAVRADETDDNPYDKAAEDAKVGDSGTDEASPDAEAETEAEAKTEEVSKEPTSTEAADAGEPPNATEEDAKAREKRPSLGVGFLHQPIPATRAGSPIAIRGKLSRKWFIDRLVLTCRRGPDGEWKDIPFKRSTSGNAVAEIPVELVESPGVDYYVVLVSENEGEEPEELFASRDQPYRIIVHGFSKRSRYESRLEEWDGRLSRIEVNYGYSSFGENLERGTTTHTAVGNKYHEFNIAYTYRFLTYLYAMRVEITGLAHDFADFKPFTAAKDDVIGPGMYAISPSLEFEFAKYFGASLLLRLGISEEDFEGGGGTSLRFGRIKGTRLDVGFEGMSHAGWRMFLRLEWDTVPYFPMSFNVERTQWYAGASYAVEDWGNRLFYEIKALLPAGIGLRVNAGFAARDQAVKGGLVIGGGAWVDF